jgi:1-acyl-sn-glycerol-3-phosphate acyltransferase
VRGLRALWRLLCAVLHIVRGVLICLVIFPRLDPAQRMARVGLWNRQLLQLLGITVQARGQVPEGAVLLVANHVSWLDILAINAVHTMRFVSKADVRHWPVIGWLVACGGTLFLERERKRDALRVVHQVAEALTAGDRIAMFPEGTTSDGHGLLPFHANLLQSAVVTGTPVLPVALRYSDSREPVSQAAAYIGDMTLVGSLWRIASAEGLRVSVQLLPTIPTAQRDRRVVSEEAREAVGRALHPAADGG